MSKLGTSDVTYCSGAEHTGTVIFFHGAGMTGAKMKRRVDSLVNFSFPHIKVVFPTAPLQPYTPAEGRVRHVWFDRLSVSQDVPEIVNSIKEVEEEVLNLLRMENAAGIDNSRIILGGFSMGGGLAFHAGYRWAKDVNSVFAFGSFLNEDSLVYKELGECFESLPPLLQLHGDFDDLVDLKWSRNTFEQLREVGVDGEFHTLERLGHNISAQGLMIVKEWIEKRLPNID